MSLGRWLAAGKSLIGIRDKSGRYRMRAEGLLPKFGHGKNPFSAPPGDGPEAEKPEPDDAERPVEDAPAPARAEPRAPRPQTAREITPSLFDPQPSGALREPIKWEVDEPRTIEVKHNTAPAAACAAPAETHPTPSEFRPLLKPANPPIADALAAKPAAPKPAGAAKAAQPNATRPAPVPAPAKPRVPWGARLDKFNPFAYLSALKPSGRQAPARHRPERVPQQAELSLERVKVVRNDLSDTDFEIVSARATKQARISLPATPAPPVREPDAGGAIREPTAWDRLSTRWFGANAGQPTQTH